MRLAIAALVVAVLSAAALAQPTENVTVTGTRSREVLLKFVQSFAAPARISGKMVRWQEGICPLTVGLKPQFTQFFTRHVKDVAARAGAPVNARSSCKPNIEIVFTTAPQALIDNVRSRRPGLLGYYDNSSQADTLAKVGHPIQAWYTTATKDLRGKSVLDSARLQGTGDTPANGSGMASLIWSSAEVTGSRLGDGKSSAFYHVIILVEPDSLKDYEIGTLGDYIAMLALTQMNGLDSCQVLPSIMNLMARNCAAVTGLSDADMVYLKGLYRMGADRNLNIQRDQIAYDMQQGLEGK